MRLAVRQVNVVRLMAGAVSDLVASPSPAGWGNGRRRTISPIRQMVQRGRKTL